MAEEQGRSGGKSYGNRKSYGSGRPGARGGKGFKPRGNGGRDGKSFGGSRDGYRKSGGFHKDGFRKDGDFRRDREAGESGGQDRGFHRGPRRDGDHGGFRRDNGGFRGKGGYRGRDDRRDGDRPRYQHRDGDQGERRDFRRDDRRDGERRNYRDHGGDRRDFRRDDRRDHDRRDFRRDGERRNDGERRDFHRDDRRDGERRNYPDHGGDRRDFRRNDGDRRDFHRDDRKDFRRDGRRDDRRDGERRNDGERREFTYEEKREYRESKRRDYLESGPRRNSDGTISFPSQNPYTDRRPDEPKMPKGMEWSMLSTDERERLRGLSKEHAENIGLHILAAYALEESDPANALEHAKWVARQASRIDFARETLAFVAYRQGDYKLALREFRTAYRMNGFLDYLPFIADCERGTGNPKKAVEMATSDEAKQLRGEAKVEMFLVYAGALADLKLWDKAIDIVHTVGRSKGLPGEYRMRAVQAEQYFLEEAGRADEAAALDGLLDKLETQYADDDENIDDVVIDHDLERFSDDELDMLGISEDDARYAPDDYDAADSDDESDDEDAENDADDGDESDDDPIRTAEAIVAADKAEDADDEETLPAQETQDGAESVVEPAQASEPDDADADADGDAEDADDESAEDGDQERSDDADESAEPQPGDASDGQPADAE